MENNTFATTIYAEAPAPRALAYLRRLQNLDEWTLGSRMIERIDDDTFMGTASGYQATLCYHVEALPHPRLGAIEWQCGYRYREYFKHYPVLVFPSRYVAPGPEDWDDGADDEDGSYIHWISVIDPARRTPMIMEGIAAVHAYEGRGLKAALERREGRARPGRGRFDVLADTMWVDAPIELGREELADPAAVPSWAPLFRAGGDAAAGELVDEYGRAIRVEITAQALGDYTLVEQDYRDLERGRVQRCPILLVPCARAFGPGAQGFLLHRLAFVDRAAPGAPGRRSAEDLVAENMAIKRRLEARAGNRASFARGMSYAGAATTMGGGGEAAPPDIFAPAFARDPYPAYRIMRDEYPLYFHAPTRAWILSRHDDVVTALTHPAFTTGSYAAQTEPLLGRTLIQLDGREHAVQRGLLAPAFRPASLRDRFVELITRTVDELVAAFAARGQADLVADYVARFPVRIMAGLLGLPAEHREQFRIWYTALIHGALNLAGDAAVALAAHAARDGLDAYLRPLIAARRRRPGPDLISQLAAAEVEGDCLTDDQIVRFGMLMVFAAGETTEKGLATVLRNVLAYPEVRAAVRADRSVLPRAIAESFRYTAPTHMVPRQSSAEVALSGGIVPAGAEVMCFLGAANRDERRFAEPDRFMLHRPEADPDRAFTGQAAHLAFGAGRHFCLGAALSRVEIEIAVSRLLDALPDVELADDPPPDVGLFLRGPAALPVRFSPRAQGALPCA